MFIVFEGLDGSGSTTQARLLTERLVTEGIPAVHTSEPTENPIGKLIRSALKKEWTADPAALQLLFSADRAHHLQEEVVPWLQGGKWVIADRYLWSTIAYGSLSGDELWLREVNARFPRADFTFLLQVSPENCVKRIEGRGEKELFEECEKLEKVWKSFIQLASGEPASMILDGEKTKEEIAEEVWSVVKRKLLLSSPT